MIYDCFFNKSMFQKPCPLISSLRPNVAPAAMSSRCVSFFSPHCTPRPHVWMGSRCQQKPCRLSPTPLHLQKHTCAVSSARLISVTHKNEHTHSSFSSSSWSPAQMCVIHNTCRKISEKYLVLPSICFVRATFEWQPMLFGPDNVVLTSTSRV